MTEMTVRVTPDDLRDSMPADWPSGWGDGLESAWYALAPRCVGHRALALALMRECPRSTITVQTSFVRIDEAVWEISMGSRERLSFINRGEHEVLPRNMQHTFPYRWAGTEIALTRLGPGDTP